VNVLFCFFVKSEFLFTAATCRVIGADALQHYGYVGCGMELPARGVLEVRCEGV
jgi:hypothetical protein